MLILAVTVAVGALVVAPRPAHAHGVGGITPSNYRSAVDPGSPGIPGVRVETIDLGSTIQLTNRSAQTVTVLGYQDEPYLRVGPDGVFENLRSPATYLNRTVTPTGTPPPSADPTKPPEWHKVSSTPVARWHDHRAHWTAPEPAIVRANPDARHVLERWTIAMTVDNNPATIAGTITWVPPLSPWPWILGAVVAAIAVGVLSRTRAWRATWLVALGVLVCGEAALLFGSWLFSSAAAVSRGLAVVYNFAGCVLAVVAFVASLRRTRHQVAPLALITGLVVFLGTGIPGFDELTRSQLPTALPFSLARAAVAGALGLGLGLVAGGAQFLRAPRPTSRPDPAESAPTA